MKQEFCEYAMVFAAGFGKRMSPITNEIAKPLVKVAGIELLTRSLNYLSQGGVDKAIVNCHYKHQQFYDFIKGYENQHLEVILSYEEKILETGGGIVKVLSYFDKPFLTINSDVIFEDGNSYNAIAALKEFWQPSIMDGLLLLCDKNKSFGYYGNGDFTLTPTKELVRDRNIDNSYVFTGLQILKPDLFSSFNEEPFSLNVIYNKALEDNKIMRKFYGLVYQGDWLHVGDLKGLAAAEDYYR